MRRIKKFIQSPKTTVVIFGLAVVLLLFSSIGGSRAALTYFSETYASRVQMYSIGVTLMEKNDGKKEAEAIAFRDYDNAASDGTWDEGRGMLLDGLLGNEADEEPQAPIVGKRYNEELSVHNSGDIDQYVRVSIYKYWGRDPEEKGQKPIKDRTLDPGLIDLNLVNLMNTDAGTSGGVWLVDGEASTRERTVLYYSKVLRAGDTTEPFTDTLMIREMAAKRVTQEVTEEVIEEETTDDGQIITSKGKKVKTVKTTYDYDGVKFFVEAKVDAVQDHNAVDAIWSAWGRRVTVDDDKKTLSLD